MTVAEELPAEPQTLAIEQVAKIISEQACWQAATAKYSADEAREFIRKGFCQPPDQIVDHPWAIIFELAGYAWERRADGVSMPQGSLFLHLILPMASEDSELEERRFNNFHGQIIAALARYNGAGYRLKPTQTDPPTRTAPKDKASSPPYWDVGYSVEWSPFG